METKSGEKEEWIGLKCEGRQTKKLVTVIVGHFCFAPVVEHGWLREVEMEIGKIIWF